MTGTRTRADRRALAAALTLAAVLAGGLALRAIDSPHAVPPRSEVAAADELRVRFDRAVSLLKVRDYVQADQALQRVLDIAPDLPEAHVNLGFARLGLGRVALARESFERAARLEPRQANAYYGLALAHEADGDLDLALGAMRSYLHLARDADPEHVRRARAALWEWESRLRPARASAPR